MQNLLSLNPPTHPPQATTSSYQSTWTTQFSMLFVRSLKQSWRNKFALGVKTFTFAAIALVFGGIYSRKNTNPPGQSAVQNFVGALFFVSTNQGKFPLPPTYPPIHPPIHPPTHPTPQHSATFNR